MNKLVIDTVFKVGQKVWIPANTDTGKATAESATIERIEISLDNSDYHGITYILDDGRRILNVHTAGYGVYATKKEATTRQIDNNPYRRRGFTYKEK